MVQQSQTTYFVNKNYSVNANIEANIELSDCERCRGRHPEISNHEQSGEVTGVQIACPNCGNKGPMVWVKTEDPEDVLYGLEMIAATIRASDLWNNPIPHKRKHYEA